MSGQQSAINLKRMPKGLPIAERFNASYSPEALTGCWLWLGAPRGSNGYGCLKVNDKPMAAHRYSYERAFGEIPKGMLVLHQCDTPMCVNPGHLFLGTLQDNSDDKVAKGRHARGSFIKAAHASNKARGERNGNSKLDRTQISEILASQESQRAIARRFCVSQALISKIQRKEIWK